MSKLWYVAYGSNMDASALRRYLPQADSELVAQRVELHRDLYFAGTSKRWGAAVAFLSLHPTYGIIPARAFLLNCDELAQIVQGENGIDFGATELAAATADLHPGEHAVLPFGQDPQGYRGKYNALLRLDDIGGLRAYTVTTARQLEPGDPAPGYLSLIQQARRTR